MPNAVVMVYPVLEHEDGTNECGKCGTLHEDEDEAIGCCSNCQTCGYRDIVGHERGEECCPCTCGQCAEEADFGGVFIDPGNNLGLQDDDDDKGGGIRSIFTRAWDTITKMPIVPNSLREIEGEHEDMDYYIAQFVDPYTDDLHAMLANYRPFYANDAAKTSHKYAGKPFLSLHIEGDEQELDMFGQPSMVSETDIFPEPRTDPYTMDMSARSLDTLEDKRRRGYATALYDMAAAILDKYGKQLVPSKDQTEDGLAFWEAKTGGDPWPVRGDL